MHIDLVNGQWAFLSTKPAGPRDVRYALAAMLVSVAVFLAAVPFAKMPLPEAPAFIPVYVASLVICDLITSALLFAQFHVLRSAGLLLLAGAYLFTACITLAYALVFPGLFALPGLPRAGLQTTSAMYMFWHALFPLLVIAYVRVRPDWRLADRPRVAILATWALVLSVVVGWTLFSTWGHGLMPIFIEGNQTTDTGRLALTGVWMVSLLALCFLWLRKPHSVLDVWLMVVLCVWLFDIALSAILNTGRYDLGWYAGRVYGMVAASYLLITLLLENARQYAHLVQVSVELGAANQALAQLSRDDGLTGLPNRRFFDAYLAEQMVLAARHQRGLALVLCDVDHFKAFNDRYGHQAGDACLQQVAAALQSCCQRPADIAARYGGEEFALVLPETGLPGATRVAEAARAAVARLNIAHDTSPAGPQVTISGGIAFMVARADMTAQELIRAADRALYQAKHQGRNRMVCAPARAGPPSSDPAPQGSGPMPLEGA